MSDVVELPWEVRRQLCGVCYLFKLHVNSEDQTQATRLAFIH